MTPENDSTFTNPEMVPIALVTEPRVCVLSIPVIMTVDGQSVGQPGHTELHDDCAGVSRHAYRVGDHHEPVRQSGVHA